MKMPDANAPVLYRELIVLINDKHHPDSEGLDDDVEDRSPSLKVLVCFPSNCIASEAIPTQSVFISAGLLMTFSVAVTCKRKQVFVVFCDGDQII